MAKGHRAQIKRERNEQKDKRPSAKLSYARVPVQKACFVLDAIRGKDLQTALGIVAYNPRYASSVIEKLLNRCCKRREQQQHGSFQTVCGRVLRKRWPDHEEDQAQSTGQSVQDP